MSKRRDMAEFVSEHPGVDQFVAVLATALWALLVTNWITVPDASRPTIYAGVATISGLAMAASTFVCTMTYQSGNLLMSKVVKTHAKALRRNWVSIIRSNLITAVIPLVALALDGTLHAVASAATIYALALLLTRSARALWWLQYTLFMQDLSVQIPERIKVAPRSDLQVPQRSSSSTRR